MAQRGRGRLWRVSRASTRVASMKYRSVLLFVVQHGQCDEADGEVIAPPGHHGEPEPVAGPGTRQSWCSRQPKATPCAEAVEKIIGWEIWVLPLIVRIMCRPSAGSVPPIRKVGRRIVSTQAVGFCWRRVRRA